MIHPDKPSWFLRRIAIFGLLILCAGVVIYIVGWGEDNELHRTAVVWAFSSAVVIVASYAGFATMEDIKLASILGKR